MSDPNKRVIDQEWLRLFIRMRGGIYKCQCGNVYFADPASPNPCPACKKTNDFPFYIKTYRYNVPIHQRTKLYACHTEKDSDDFATLAAEIHGRMSYVSGKYTGNRQCSHLKTENNDRADKIYTEFSF
jgi:hypothetical protein